MNQSKFETYNNFVTYINEINECKVNVCELSVKVQFNDEFSHQIFSYYNATFQKKEKTLEDIKKEISWFREIANEQVIKYKVHCIFSVYLKIYNNEVYVNYVENIPV